MREKAETPAGVAAQSSKTLVSQRTFNAIKFSESIQNRGRETSCF